MKFWHSGALTEDIDSAIDFICATGASSREKWTVIDVEFMQSKMTCGNGGKLRAAFGRVGDSIIELLQPLDDSSYHAHVLKTRGPGFHHNAYVCGDDLDNTIDALVGCGSKIVWEFQDGDEHACYVEAESGAIVLELINIRPVEVQ